MLPPAMEALTDPCLPDSWNVYGAYAGLFAMSAALIMQLIEFIARQRYQSNRDSETYPLFGSKSESSGRSEQSEISESAHHSHGFGLQDDIQNRKISTYLLEFGIALHSVLIGLTLGTTINSFVPLFIALSLHQFFEAIALGAQIARLDQLPLRSAIFMVIFFTFTTPIGIAIGIGIHSTTYSPKSVLSLLINGILDSVSGGILIYVALVNLITAEMGAGARAFHLLSKQLKFLYFISLYAGVAAMAVIGRWV
jgi:zinc transporter 1/2/3